MVALRKTYEKLLKTKKNIIVQHFKMHLKKNSCTYFYSIDTYLEEIEYTQNEKH